MDDAEAVIQKMHAALGDFVRGDARSAVQLFSRRSDVTLGNPFGPFVTGWAAVADMASDAASHYRDGEVAGIERIASYEAPDLAGFVEVERYRAKIGDSDQRADVALRVSTLVRREDGGWRIVSRHADPITVARPAESVIQQSDIGQG